MKFPQNPNFKVEDFLSEKEWIGKLFILINPVIQALNQIFDNNIDFETNIKSVTNEYTITNFQEFAFQWPYPTQSPVTVNVVSATKGNSRSPVLLFPVWEYDSQDQSITISNIFEMSSTGIAALTANTRYSFKIRATV